MHYQAFEDRPNALKRVAFVIALSQPFTEVDFDKVDIFWKNNWRSELPKRSQARAVYMRADMPSNQFQPQQLVGLNYEALQKDGTVETGISFDGHNIILAIGKYDTWEKEWPAACMILEQALQLKPENAMIMSLAIEYFDLFEAKGGYDDFVPEGFLRKDSKYVPPYIFYEKENWHFHTGYFERHENPAPHRVLHRINADLKDNDENSTRELALTLFHQISPTRTPWVSENPLADEIVTRGVQNFPNLHEIGKTVLRNVLNDDMCKKIGLM